MIMIKKLAKINLFIIISSAIIIGAGFSFSNTAQAASLNGRILLQVQAQGQAWYINPVNSNRYYLGRPNDAFLVMRSLGLGISNSDLNSFLVKAPARLSGRILLKVQDKGQAYYVNPLDLKLYYLGRPADAFQVMRNLGLGISNSDLAKIKIATTSSLPLNSTPVAVQPVVVAPINDQVKTFSFIYQNNNYQISQPLSAAVYNSYKNSPKVYTYTSNNEPPNLREVFYGLFLNLKSNDTSLDDIVSKLKNIATTNNWSDDQLLEFTLAFIQYIPYDQSKVTANPGVNSNPFFPYETLYLDKGVCSDKTFLGVALLRKLGYGAAILDFPDKNHTALGIACPVQYSINNSGYCYGETTNYFPLGVIPETISSGQAQNANEFDNLFNAAGLGKIEMYQKTTGKIYQGIPALMAKIQILKTDKDSIDTQKAEIANLNSNLAAEAANISTVKSTLDSYYNNGQLKEYNSLVTQYNSLVNQYNSDLLVYKNKVDSYNILVNEFNSLFKAFYQQ